MPRSQWSGPPCPQDADHGRLLDWPNSWAAFYCPNAAHEGNRFYRTDLAPASKSDADALSASSAPDGAAGSRGRRRQAAPIREADPLSLL